MLKIARPLLLAAAGLAAFPALAQRSDAPLGEVLDGLGPVEQGEEPRQSPPPAPPPAPIPPASADLIPPSGVGTTALPPSRVPRLPDPDTASLIAAGEPAGTLDPIMLDPPVLDPPVLDPTEPDPAAAAAEAAWAARQEERRQAVNALEGPEVRRLNAEAAARQEAAARAAAEAEEAHRHALRDREEQILRAEQDHLAALERHRAEVARQQAEHQRAVAACLAGDHRFCAPPPGRR